MSIAKSEVFDIYAKKGLPMHMYCADTKENVEFCIKKRDSLITANDPKALLEFIK